MAKPFDLKSAIPALICTPNSGHRNGGRIMRYSKEYKLKCIEQYRRSEWPKTPDGVSQKMFRHQIRVWMLLLEKHGEEALDAKKHNRKWSESQRKEIASKVIGGAPLEPTAIEAGISNGLLHDWVKRYKMEEEKERIRQRNFATSKEKKVNSKKHPPIKATEEQERIKELEERIMYLEAENAYLKKLKALRKENAAGLKAKKQLQ